MPRSSRGRSPAMSADGAPPSYAVGYPSGSFPSHAIYGRRGEHYSNSNDPSPIPATPQFASDTSTEVAQVVREGGHRAIRQLITDAPFVKDASSTQPLRKSDFLFGDSVDDPEAVFIGAEHWLHKTGNGFIYLPEIPRHRSLTELRFPAVELLRHRLHHHQRRRSRVERRSSAYRWISRAHSSRGLPPDREDRPLRSRADPASASRATARGERRRLLFEWHTTDVSETHLRRLPPRAGRADADILPVALARSSTRGEPRDHSRPTVGSRQVLTLREVTWDLLGTTSPVFHPRRDQSPTVIHGLQTRTRGRIIQETGRALRLPLGPPPAESLHSASSSSSTNVGITQRDNTASAGGGFGVNTYTFIKQEGKRQLIKFHWKPNCGSSASWERRGRAGRRREKRTATRPGSRTTP
ncbi:uncharacterized protein A4U43_C07F21950 [Asparagus officinalis]|uniref:Catalase core domain-containing protein n=1 Tax=Asparagus officinalis TaxID=4686 RepID=A0A5P1EFU6_ASPOF|nr:uncharacterized protein A4U43_C07F21950 [Asparagus officinalis]